MLIKCSQTQTTEDATVLSLKDLKKNNMIVKGQVRSYVTYGCELTSYYTGLNNRLVVNYLSGEEWIEQHIQLIELPSNLGKGSVLFFKCPKTGKRCTKLYLAYDSKRFMSREAYKPRLYYPCQLELKSYQSTEKFFRLSYELKKLKGSRRAQYSYNGKATLFIKRIKSIEDRLPSLKEIVVESVSFSNS